MQTASPPLADRSDELELTLNGIMTLIILIV